MGDTIEYENVALTKVSNSNSSFNGESFFRGRLNTSNQDIETTYTYYNENDGDKAGLVKSIHRTISSKGMSPVKIEQEIDHLTGNILSETCNGQTINYKYDNNGNFLSASSITSINTRDSSSGELKK